MREFFEDLGLGGMYGLVVGFVVGLVLGCVVAFCINDKFVREWNARGDLETACIEGNANACRIYEVRYGR